MKDMKYNNTTVRRQDRLLEDESAIKLLETGEYGVLSMISTDGSAYGIPISYAWDKQSAIYLHCAPEGEKLRNIAQDSTVSFCIVGQTEVISNQFTTAYESLVLRGKAVKITEREERMHALELILDKYSPNDKEVGMKYAEKSFDRTAIIRIDVETFSGKTKKIR